MNFTKQHWGKILEKIGGLVEIQLVEKTIVINETRKLTYEFIPNMDGYELYLMENDDDPEMASIEGLMEVCGDWIRDNAEYQNFEEIFNDDRYTLKIKVDGKAVSLEDIKTAA